MSQEGIDGYQPFKADRSSKSSLSASPVAVVGSVYEKRRNSSRLVGEAEGEAELTNLISVKPRSLLVMFTSLSFFLYFDRGVFSALMKSVKHDFDMNNLQAGICSSAYLVAYCLSSPIFAQVAKYRAPLRLCSIGMVVWVIAVVFSGLSTDFMTLMFARALTGLGEASFLVMAAPFIDFFAPPAKRSTWLAIYYSAIPIGYAGGAFVGSLIVQSHVFGSWTWRSVYFLEAILVLPCVLLFSTIRGPKSMLEVSVEQNKQNESLPQGESQVQQSAAQAFLSDVLALISNKLYVVIVLGYAMQTFFVGAVALYAIGYLEKYFKLSEGTSGGIFGAITALTGLGGSAMGGVLLDYLKPKSANASLAECEVAAHKIMATCAAIAAPASMLAFKMPSLGGFLPLLVLGETAAFMMSGPINSAVVWSVPIALQPTACAMCNLVIHVLGDALSPILIGALADKIGLRTSLGIASAFLILSTTLFLVGLAMAHRMTRLERPSNRSRLMDDMGNV